LHAEYSDWTCVVQIVTAATEVLASQVAVFKALEEYMVPFGYKRPKSQTQAQVGAASPPAAPVTPRTDDEVESDENNENVEADTPQPSPIEVQAAIPDPAPSPFRQPILNAEDAPTPTYVNCLHARYAELCF
jgi:hypothetical protein